MRPNETKDTVWYMMNDDRLMKEIDFELFEKEFRLSTTPIGMQDKSAGVNGGGAGVGAGGKSKVDGFKAKLPPAQQKDSLMEYERLKGIAIRARRLPSDLSTPDLVKAINGLDTDVLNIETIELLQRMVPLECEVQAYKQYFLAKKDVDKLTDEDKLMRQFACVERFALKLDIMAYMSAFDENVKTLRPQIDALTMASKSVKTSAKMKRVLEIILALGNYMNSSKKGPCYGFRLESLESLTITKAGQNKKRNFLHYIHDLVVEKYPDLQNFYTELKFIDKASQFALDSILSEVDALEKGMRDTKRELDHRTANAASGTGANSQASSDKLAQNKRLSDFYNRCNEIMTKLKSDSINGQKLFKECLEHYGEDTSTAKMSTFFGYFVKFVKAWKTAEVENERYRQALILEAKKREAAKKLQNSQQNAAAATARKNQANSDGSRRGSGHSAVINELKAKSGGNANDGIISPQDIDNGTFEDILLEIKKPLRTNVNGAVRGRHRLSINASDNLNLKTNESEVM